MKRICVFCGSTDTCQPEYLPAAYAFGKAIAERDLQLWYGAGITGLMGALADGALASGGEVIGVIPELFNTPVLAHAGLTRLEVVETMHIRKQRLFEVAEAFVALPGGFGTFEELFEILTWAQIGLHQKPIGLLNIRNYFAPLQKMVAHARDEGFIYEVHNELLTVADQPWVLLDALSRYQSPPDLDRWLTRIDKLDEPE